MDRLPRTVAPATTTSRPLDRLLRELFAGLLLGLALAILSGCASVPFYEKGQLQDPIMVLAPDATEAHAFQKIYYSREGSVGGIGQGAGGGCGCY